MIPLMDRALSHYDTKSVAAAQRARVKDALFASLAFVALLGLVHFTQLLAPFISNWGVVPLTAGGLVGLASAPLLHADWGHLASNAVGLAVLGTLMGSVYPRCALRIVLLGWVGAGVFTWLIGRPANHLGASGLVHTLFFALFTLAALRRDRHALVAAFSALMLFGGMLFTVLPQELEISWEMHAGGALMGVLGAVLWRHRDPPPSRPMYSWESEEEEALAEAGRRVQEQHTFEPARPDDVPVLWRRPEPEGTRGQVLLFRRRGKDDVNRDDRAG